MSEQTKASIAGRTTIEYAWWKKSWEAVRHPNPNPSIRKFIAISVVAMMTLIAEWLNLPLIGWASETYPVVYNSPIVQTVWAILTVSGWVYLIWFYAIWRFAVKDLVDKP